MAVNPFNIDSLKTVNFDNDVIRQITILALDPSNGGSSGGSAITPYELAPSGFNPGSITVVDSNYLPGHTETYSYGGYDISNYYLPTFGALQFEGDSTTYWVHGFSENGLLLSDSPDIRWSPDGGQGIYTPDASPANLFIFGMYGVTGRGEAPGLPGSVAADVVFDNDPIVFHDIYCFAEGTSIATPEGSVVVEALSIGDLALTASGKARPVKWIGQLLARPSRHPRPHEVSPVRVRAGSFGEGLPLRDLRLSPGHAVYVDGVLVPVGHLVNGATIVQEQVEQIRYFHVELDSHDVLLAEGLPCESYLDDGNRAAAVNATEFTQLYGRLDPKSWDDACAPLVADGPQLAAIRQMLHARADALGWTRCETADLVIDADGVTILPESFEGASFRFTVPAAASVVLRSNAGVLGQMMPELADRRLLGVAVSGITVNSNAADLDDALFGAGFHQVEREDALAWRWSDGAGMLELGGEPATIEVSLAMVAPSWKRGAAMRSIAA